MGEDPAAGIANKIDEAKLKALTAGDEHPRFVTLQVACEGIDKNKRNYTAELIEDIAEQINDSQPIGGAGHVPDEQRSHAFPPTEAVWLGAVVKEIDGKKVVYAKGYVLPDAHNRWNHLKMAKAMGKNVAVYIRQGQGSRLQHDSKGLRHQGTGAGADRLHAAGGRGHPQRRHPDPDQRDG